MSMAQMYLGLPHDVLSDVEPPTTDPKIRIRIGLDYMERAAQAGERNAMVYLARAYDTGFNLPDPSMKDVSR
jgi:elongation factor 2 kinase